MLASQNIRIPFGVGVDEKIQELLLDPGQIGYVQNLRINKTGSYSKRNGYAALTAVGSRAERMGQFRGAPIVFDGTNLKQYSAQGEFWTDTGSVSNVVATRQPLTAGTALLPYYDIAYTNGYFCLVFSKENTTGGTNTFAVFVDATTGNAVGPGVQVGGTFDRPKFKVIACGNTFVILIGRSGANTLFCYTADATDLPSGLTAVGNILIDIQLYGGFGTIEMNFDACPTSTTTFGVVYRSSLLAFNIVRCARFTIGATVPTFNVSHTASAEEIIAIGCACKQGSEFWVGVNGSPLGGNSTVWGTMLNPSTMATISGFGQVLEMTSGSVPRTIGIVPKTASLSCFVAGNANSRHDVVWTNASAAGGTVTGSLSNTIYRYAINGKPFYQGDKVYLPITLYGTVQTEPTGFLVSLEEEKNGIAWALPVSTHLARIVNTSVITPWAPNTISNLAGGVFAALYPQKAESSSTALTAVRFDFTQKNRWQNDEMFGGMRFSAGVPSTFDGQLPTELGFLNAPTSIVAQGTGSPGNLKGIYSYTAIYEWTTSTGEIVQSAPAIPFQLDNSGATDPESATVTVDALQLSYKITSSLSRSSAPLNLVGIEHPVRIAVYRTTTGGTTYYRVPVDLFQTNEVGIPSQLQLTDDTSDVILETQQLLYIQPNEPGSALAKFCPPSASLMVVHRNRIFLVGDDGITIYFSGQFVDGEQPWFSDQFVIQVPKGGPITAMESMDGVLYIFKRDFVFSVTGDGPVDNGSGNDFSVAEEIDIEVGCIDARSLVLAPGGIFYQSPQGLYLLTRSRTAEYTGKNIQVVLDAYPNVLSASISDRNGCIYWEVANSNTGGIGSTIVYDYVHGQWLIDFKSNNLTGAITGSHGGEVINGIYYWVTLTGQANIETPGQYLDAGRWVDAQIDTPWIKVANLEGFSRIWIAQLMVSKDFNDAGSHGIFVSLYRNYGGAPFQDFDWQASEVDALTTSQQQLQMNPRIQKCESILVSMHDQAPDAGTTTGRGPTWIGLQLEVGVKTGLYKLPAANSK